MINKNYFTSLKITPTGEFDTRMYHNLQYYTFTTLKLCDVELDPVLD
jgi:hypothetical protein